MKTLAIVGSQNRTRDLAPWDDPAVDIWVFNEAANLDWCKRASAVFQMHAPEIYRSRNNRSDPAHWQWLQRPHDGVTVYMQDVDALVPCSARYPLKEIAAALLPGFRQGVDLQPKTYFTNTVAYALALAIYKQYDKILLYGVEMQSNTEYTYQRPCVLFWVGCAIGRGIAVDFISGDDIFAVPLYGYDGILATDPALFTLRAEQLRAGLAEQIDRKSALEKQLEAGQNNGNLGDLLSAIADVYGMIGNLQGRLDENERYAFKAIEMIAETGLAYIERNEYESMAALREQEIGQHESFMFMFQGVVNEAYPYWERSHNPAVLGKIKHYHRLMCEKAQAAGYAVGAREENTRLMDLLDERIQAAGGQKAAEMMEGQWQPAITAP